MKRTTRGTQTLAFALLASVAFCAPAYATIMDVALYELGEAGTIVGGNPQDSVGGHHFQNTFGVQAAITPGAFSGSTAANNYGGDGGSYATAGGTTVIPTDNVAIEMWARTGDTAQINRTLFSSGAADGSLALNLFAGQWRASRFNQVFLGDGVDAVADEWVNLALIRENGMTTFYVDGIAQGAADATIPIVDVATFHIGVNPGDGFRFDGDLDNLRIFTFDPNTDNPVAALTVNLPEPTSIALWALLGIAAGGFAWRKGYRFPRR